jgi:hypothetical protein
MENVSVRVILQNLPNFLRQVPGPEPLKLEPYCVKIPALKPLYQYETAVPGDLKFERLWLPLKGK